MIGLANLTILLSLALLAPVLTPYERDRVRLRERFQAPSQTHWMGTDELGRDVFTRVLYAGRVSLSVGFLVAISSTVIGGVVGVISGYVGGRVDEVTMRFVDVLRSLPALPILIVLSQLLRLQFGVSGGIWTIIIILVVLGWTGIARIVRGVVLSLKEQQFVVAARAAGATQTRIIFVHLFPNVTSQMIVAVTLGAGSAISAESALSFLGLGIQPPTPSWGNMLFNAQSYLWNEPWIAVFPGLFIFITLLSFNFVGDGLRDALDPRTR
jgi:peptide/nickel transport system permease protein